MTDGTSIPVAKAQGRPMLQWVELCSNDMLGEEVLVVEDR